VRPRHRLLDAVAVGERHRARLLGLRPGAQPACAELDLVGRLVARKHLSIGVHGDELHALHAAVDHVVHRIAAGAAYAYDLDDGTADLALDYLEHSCYLLAG
jgi:hypothetical protein